MMAGIHHMEQARCGDTQHFELLAQGIDAHPDPETSCTANYDMPGDMEQDLQHIYNNYNALQETVDIEKLVVLNPEVLMCGTNFHPEPQLTFSADGFKIEYLDPDSGQDGGLIILFWEVSGIISIDCKWIQMVQSALITLHVRSSAETVDSGPVKVEFCLVDPQWEWKQQQIWQLDSRYQEVWKNIQSDDFASQNGSTEPSLCFPRQYFHGNGDFEDVTYPKGDREAVSISSRDVELLLPEIFVNDTIIDFYIKYLSTRIEPTERCRYHFFNSFFFRKLADLDKDQEKAPKGREAFLCVRKWTRKIDIFAKDFLFIPVNFSLHWSLLVICYPGEVDIFNKDGDARIAAKLPCIIHMNSIKGTHSGLKDIIQSYLWEEWKERHPESASDSSDKFLNLRFLSLELPQQDNLFDCGLFLLHYVERFLMDAPSFFNPMKIDVFSSFLGDDWFVPAEASLKRSLIRKLIHELVTEPSKIYPKLVCGDEKHDERHHRSEKAVGEPSREYLGQGYFAAEPDSVCRILGAHQQSKLLCLNDSEKELSVPGCILETGGVSMVAQQEMQVCPSDDDVVVCSPSQDPKNEPFFAYSGNQLDPKSCAPEDAEGFKGSCSVLKDKNSHQQSLLNILETGGVSMFAEQEMQMCPSDDEVMACQASRNKVENGRHEASQDMDPVTMLVASKHDTGTGQESTEGKADNGRCDLSEDTDSFATSSINKDVAERPFKRDIVENMDGRSDLSECSLERSTVEVVDPGAVEDDTKAEKTSTTAGTINDSEQYVSSESKDGNSSSIMSSGSTVSCVLKEGKVAGGTTNGTSEAHADGEDACHNLATGEAAPCEDDITCTYAEIPHVNGISTCSAKDETYSEKATSNARRPLLGSTSEDKSILVSGGMCSLKGVQCTKDGIIKGSTKEETSTISDKINDSTHYASSESGDQNTDNAIAGESTKGTEADGHELVAFPCGSGTDAEMPPHVDGTCSAEDENNSIFDGVCEAKKTQASEDFRSTLKDGIIEGRTKEETSTISDKINDDTRYASSDFKDGNTDNAIASESTQEADADGHELMAFPCEGGTVAEMPPHIDGTCSAEVVNNSISDSVCKAKKTQASEDFRSTLEDGIIEGSTKEETSTISDKINDSTQYASSEFGNGNTDNAIAGESTQVADADNHELAAFPCESGTDVEMPPHVDGTCSAEDENNSISDSVCEAKKMQVSEDFRAISKDEETGTSAEKMNGSGQYASYESEDGNTNQTGSGSEKHVSSEAKNEKCRVGAKRPCPDSSSCEAKKMQVSEDFRSTSENDLIEGSTKEETDTDADKINGSEQYASYDSEDGNTNRAGSGSEQHDVSSEAENEKCRVGAKRPCPDSSSCEAKKMQVSEDFTSTPEDGIIEGSAKEETGTSADKMNGSEQYASHESEDGNTDRAGSGSGSEQLDVSPQAENEKCPVGAKRPFPDSSTCEAKENVTLDDKFWQEYSERTEARFGRKYKRRIVWRRRNVISWAPPSSSEYSDSDSDLD